MSRGRGEDRAVVVCSDERDEYGPRHELDAMELLGKVTRHAGADRSAHDVMRRALARHEDVELLRDLLAEAMRHIDASAGPDRAEEIAALVARADVEGAQARLVVAEERARRESERRAETECRAARAGGRRDRGPFLGRRARDEKQAASRVAPQGAELAIARSDEARCLEVWDKARRQVTASEHAVRELARARVAQGARLRWLSEHPEELGCADELRQRRDARSQERGRAGASSERESTESTVASRTVRALLARQRRHDPLGARPPVSARSGVSDRSSEAPGAPIGAPGHGWSRSRSALAIWAGVLHSRRSVGAAPYPSIWAVPSPALPLSRPSENDVLASGILER
jgi:hypothetical protein